MNYDIFDYPTILDKFSPDTGWTIGVTTTTLEYLLLSKYSNNIFFFFFRLYSEGPHTKYTHTIKRGKGEIKKVRSRKRGGEVFVVPSESFRERIHTASRLTTWSSSSFSEVYSTNLVTTLK